MKKIILLFALLLIYPKSSRCMKHNKKQSQQQLMLCPITYENSQATYNFIRRNFKQYNLEKIGEDLKPCSIKIGNSQNGYISVRNEWGCADIQKIYVPKDSQIPNLGILLIRKALKFAKEKKLNFAVIETFDEKEAQALKELGFKEEHVQQGYKKNKKLYFLKKDTIDFVEPKEDYIDPFSGKHKSTSFYKGETFGFLLTLNREIIGVAKGTMRTMTLGATSVFSVIVKKEHRSNGYGKLLTNTVLEHAKKQGCTFATLDTFGFQAPKFYEKKLGFTIDFERSGYEQGRKLYFMSKKL